MSVYNIENNVLFVHNPKCAGTSMEACNFLVGDYRYGRGGHFPYYMYELLVAGVDSVFSFAFVRDPRDRLVSAFFHPGTQWPRDDFKGFVKKLEGTPAPVMGTFPRQDKIRWWLPQRFLPQWFFICDRDDVAGVDFLGRFENLEADWRHVCMEVLGYPCELPHVRAGRHPDYRTCYDDETWEIAGRVYARDIELLGYEN